MIGSVIGTYRIEAYLGTGGMGTVYRGVDVLLDRPVAIKVLKPELVNNPQLIERFRTEAILLAKLNHPNIAILYGFLPISSQQFAMVMEFLPGLSLDTWLRQHGAMPLGQVVTVFSGILDAIGHAHRHGIIHRDIKPSNVMVLPDGTPKVMDFGIARALGSNRQTRVGTIIGTLEYMSPEQIQGKEIDTRSDIYALGILLYEMLTGRTPFVADSEYELLQAHIYNPPPPPQVLAPTIPEAVAQVVLRALEKEPQRRFQTAEEFKLALSMAVAPSLAATSDHPPLASSLPLSQPASSATLLTPVRGAPSVHDHARPRPASKLTEQPWRRFLTWGVAGFAVFVFLLAIASYIWVQLYGVPSPAGNVATQPPVRKPVEKSADAKMPAATSPVSLEDPARVEIEHEEVQTLLPPGVPVVAPPPPIRNPASEEVKHQTSPKRPGNKQAGMSERERRRREALKALDQ